MEQVGLSSSGAACTASIFAGIAWSRASSFYEKLLPFAWPRRLLAQGITLFLVVIAWVFFRAADIHSAFRMLESMFGLGAGCEVTYGVSNPLLLVIATGVIALLAPNVIDIFAGFQPALALDRQNPRRLLSLLDRVRWRASPGWGLATGTVAGVGVVAILGWQPEFLYFQF
jgi:hypothetical protein